MRPLHSLWIDLLVLRLLNEPKEGQHPVWFVLDELASLQRLPQLHTAITENRKSKNPIVLGFQGKAQLEYIYGHMAEVMLSQPATKIFLKTTEPKAAEWVSSAIGKVEIERMRQTHFDGSRTGKNFTLERQVEPLVMDSEISGLPDRHAYLKLGNYVACFSFAYHDIPATQPAFVPRPLDDDELGFDPKTLAKKAVRAGSNRRKRRSHSERLFIGRLSHAENLESPFRRQTRKLPQAGIHFAGPKLLEPGADRAGRMAGPACREIRPRWSRWQPMSFTGSRKVSTRRPASNLFSIGSPSSTKDANGKTVKSVEHRAGWDATFSAPKSVSLTALVGGDSRVREAHRMAVTTALGELERYTQARLGGNHPAESTGQFIVAKFEHDTSRPVDGYAAPQLHTHAVIFNVTERADGTTRALQDRRASSSRSSSPLPSTSRS